MPRLSGAMFARFRRPPLSWKTLSPLKSPTPSCNGTAVIPSPGFGELSGSLLFRTMLKLPVKLAERLDQWTDHWNPVLVRELRASIRGGHLPLFVILYFLAVPGLFLFFLYNPPNVYDIPEGIPPDIFPEAVLVYVTSLFAFGGGSALPVIRLILAQSRDELLNLTGMTPKEVLWGYLQLGTMLSGFVTCCTFVVLLVWTCFVGGQLWDLLLWSLSLVFAGSVVVNLVALSVFVKAKTFLQQCTTFFGHYFAVVLSFMVVVWIWERPPNPSFTQVILSLLYGILFFGIMAYRLALYHFEHPHETLLAAMVRNILFYNIAGVLTLIFSLMFLCVIL
jgi:hypothetical protein